LSSRRAPEEESLSEANTQQAQFVPIFLGLDPLGDQLESSLASEVDEACNQHGTRQVAHH